MIYQQLNNAHPHMKVYLKADIPDRYHYKNHLRIAPILAEADEHWHILVSEDSHCEYAEAN